MIRAGKEHDGGTPLHFSIAADNYKCFLALLSAGVDAKAAAKSGLTPLQMLLGRLARWNSWNAYSAQDRKAAEEGVLAIAQLMRAGAKLGACPLHLVAENASDSNLATKLIHALLEVGADPLETNASGELAISVAARNRNDAGKAVLLVLVSAVAELCEKEKKEREAEKQKQEAAQTCIICNDAPRTHAFLPCGHFAFCEACAEASAAKCPVCRKKPRSTQTIHLS
ncbi:mitochondrial ubiquitin ligase activator of NFKB 1 [Chlorella sorokiniana]|uniref:Mitochondrial ubiquitin ligase activator of NFKB 1 n=1 Tax=Chlorella sorokiniana TaxID=3076 RepID=A0A2P6TZ69_CHLSO|nr:mitochondrial ubiquitin ligase activator of NFKB 1 [Chlorella sorokiniana]|eukprot:PRW59361.1 mitochondrial ubiquitin ligase activator of NFKB 1 [Chlorella sorokiniana]